MPTVVVSRADDEIADLIDRVRSAGEPDVGLVIPPGGKAMQTPLNARLLSQFCRSAGTRTAIISDDARVQQLAAGSGFTVYASQLAYERGIELLPPRTPAGMGSPPAGSVASAAVALQEAPPGVATTVPGPPPPPPPSGPRIEPRRQITVPGPAPRSTWRDRRRVLYFAGAAVGIVGLLLFFTLSPSATISITVAATPLSVNQTIQGSSDTSQSSQADHILTS